MPDCCQWLSGSILWFVYIPDVCWEHSTTVCGLMAEKAHLQLAHPPTPSPFHPPPSPLPLSPTHPFISDTCVITVVVKNYLKNQQWILQGRVSYETVAISMLYLYSKSCAAIMHHRRSTAASMIQNGILEIQNVITWSFFPNLVTYVLELYLDPMYTTKINVIALLQVYSWFLKNNKSLQSFTYSKLNTTIEMIMLLCINNCHNNVKF